MEDWIELIEWLQEKKYNPFDVKLIISLDELAVKSKEYTGQLELLL